MKAMPMLRNALAAASAGIVMFGSAAWADEAEYTGDKELLADGSVLITFRRSGTLTLPAHTDLDVLVVGGGGAGGAQTGGGGGGGGVIFKENYTVDAGTYDVVVGAGASVTVSDVTKTTYKITTGTSSESSVFGITAYGGGNAGGFAGGGRDGASGGGAGGYYTGYPFDVQGGGKAIYNTEDEIQGYPGGRSIIITANYNAAGGGGAGGPGASQWEFVNNADGTVTTNITGDAGFGGVGRTITMGGRTGVYGSGGAAYAMRGLPGATGTGNNMYSVTRESGSVTEEFIEDEKANDGAANTGAGGGGSGGANHKGIPGAGGSGVVIVQYRPVKMPPWATESVLWPNANGERVTINSAKYVLHVFKENATVTVPKGVLCDLLIVAGGGGGGNGSGDHPGGGGGAGGVYALTNYYVEAGTYDIVVGEGGKGGAGPYQCGSNGCDSVAFGLTVPGGGGGSRGSSDICLNGGSGGGRGTKGTRYASGRGIAPFGHNGDEEEYGLANRAAGGGGGAGGCSVLSSSEGRGGCGGVGIVSDITGEEVVYGGGGGGGSYVWGRHTESWLPEGKGGLGGGGNGATLYDAPENGEANTGGGGGGGTQAGNHGGECGDGGSGIVIVRYRLKPSGFLIQVR